VRCSVTFKYPLFICFLVVIAISTHAQQITNVTSQAVGDKIIVHYNIEGSKEDQSYEVALYSSHDLYAKALRSVSGNGIGPTVSPGKERVIIWDVLNDVNQLKGPVTFEVRALVKSRVIIIDKSSDMSAGSSGANTRDEAYQQISATLADYVNEAKDFKDAMALLGIQATESRQALTKLSDALDQYNRAFEKLNKERLSYEKYVHILWDREVLTLEFKSLLDYAIGDLHSVNILTLNQKIAVINDLANSRVKKPGDVKKELAKDINEEVPKLDKRLQELERRMNRVLHALGED
jgi:hypothetical protein